MKLRVTTARVTIVHCHALLRPGCPRIVPSPPATSRRLLRIVPVQASSQPQEPRDAQPALSYSEALMQREQQLWERQEGMMRSLSVEFNENYNCLLSTYEQLQLRYNADRDAWTKLEEDLRQENKELRAQLMYALTQLAGGAAGGGRERAPFPGPAPFDVPPAAPPPQLGSSASKLPGRVVDNIAELSEVLAQMMAQLGEASPQMGRADASEEDTSAGQVQSQLEAAMKKLASMGGRVEEPDQTPLRPPPPPPPVQQPSPAAPRSPSSQPAWAAQVAAAMAAVDDLDILRDDVDYSKLARQQRAQQAAASPPPPASPTPAPPPPSASAPPPAPGAAPHGPPPTLALGADDIFWVSQLHAGLAGAGYYPAEEDMEDFYFGDSTQAALLTMQACEGLAETGVADEATWRALLGPELRPKSPPPEPHSGDHRPRLEEEQQQRRGGEGEAGGKGYTEFFSASLHESVSTGVGGEVRSAHSELSVHDTRVAPGGGVTDDSVTVRQQASAAPGGGLRVSGSVSTRHTEDIAALTEWPVLLEGDGGRLVHALHIALESAGYYPGEDDLRWWIFGTETVAALKTCQACSGLAESGVADVATWEVLLGQGATPADLAALRSGNSDDEDLEFTGDRVWLIGEQRWQDSSRLRGR